MQDQSLVKFGNLHYSQVPTLSKEMFMPSDRYGYINSIRIIIVLFMLLYLLPFAYEKWSVLGLLVLAPFVGASIYKVTFILHECAHYTLFKSRKTNKIPEYG